VSVAVAIVVVVAGISSVFVAVIVTAPEVAPTHVARPFDTPAALLIETFFVSEVVHVAWTVAIVSGNAHPLPEITYG